jgi:Fic family protein
MDMFRSGRAPTNKDERMIFNNLIGMEFIREHKKEKLSPDLVLEIHRRMTKGLLPDHLVGRMQSPEDTRIHVGSNRTGEVLHEPPPAEQLPQRMQAMCDFANKINESEFLHPVLRAIILHLWLAYDHPFADGNGRTARALFYWMMLREDYWLFELVSISTILKRASAQYGRSFLYTETDESDSTYFVIYQLEVICRALRALEGYLAKKTREIQEAERALKDMGVFNHRQLALLGHALRNPHAEYTVKSHQVSHQVAYATARSDLLDLVKRGLLEVRQFGNRAHYFPTQALMGHGLQANGKDRR